MPHSAQIAIIEDEMRYSELMANWWLAYATTGACTRVDKYREGKTAEDGTPMTGAEKIEDALQTSCAFIERFKELGVTKAALLQNQPIPS